jgi:hypothetical protein
MFWVFQNVFNVVHQWNHNADSLCMLFIIAQVTYVGQVAARHFGSLFRHSFLKMASDSREASDIDDDNAADAVLLSSPEERITDTVAETDASQLTIARSENADRWSEEELAMLFSDEETTRLQRRRKQQESGEDDSDENSSSGSTGLQNCQGEDYIRQYRIVYSETWTLKSMSFELGSCYLVGDVSHPSRTQAFMVMSRFHRLDPRHRTAAIPYLGLNIMTEPSTPGIYIWDHHMAIDAANPCSGLSGERWSYN